MLKRIYILWLSLVAVSGLIACQPELPTLQASNRIQLSDSPVVAAKLSSDGQFSYLLLANNHLQKWQNNDASLIREWQALDDDSLHLAISEDASHVITANQKALTLWFADATTPLGNLDLTMQLGDANITAVDFWQSPSVFLIGTSAGTIFVADIHNSTYRAMQQHGGEVTKFARFNDTQYLLSGGNDGLAILWDMRQFQLKEKVDTPFRITSLTVSSDSGLTFISDALEKQLLWQPVKNQIISELEYWQQYKWFRLATFIQNDKYLITTSPKTEITLWDISSNEAIAMWGSESHSMGSTVLDMTYLNNHRLVTLTSDAVLEHWEITSLINNP
ncbi:MAG: WD40 repeat domain-containing protein [Aestuariibacter sp.]